MALTLTRAEASVARVEAQGNGSAGAGPGRSRDPPLTAPRSLPPRIKARGGALVARSLMARRSVPLRLNPDRAPVRVRANSNPVGSRSASRQGRRGEVRSGQGGSLPGRASDPDPCPANSSLPASHGGSISKARAGATDTPPPVRYIAKRHAAFPPRVLASHAPARDPRVARPCLPRRGR